MCADLFVGVVEAAQPVERLDPGVHIVMPGEAQFFAEDAVLEARVGDVEDRRPREVGIAAGRLRIVAIGDDVGELDVGAELPVELAGGAHVLVVHRIARTIERFPESLAVGDGQHRSVQRLKRVDDGRRRAVEDADGRAAMLGAVREVDDHAQRDIAVRFPQRLALEVVAVAIVDALAAVHLFHEAVVIVVDTAPAREQGVRDRDVDPAVEFVAVVIGRRRFQETGMAVVRRARDDVERAGRGVLAEQRALRAFQHLDAFDVDQIAKGQTATIAVDAVDEGAHGAFETRIVARGAHAADLERGIGCAARGRVHEQTRRDRLQIVNGVDVRLTQVIAAIRIDGDRHHLDVLRSLLCGHHYSFDLCFGGARNKQGHEHAKRDPTAESIRRHSVSP